jgi:hypothetical protein
MIILVPLRRLLGLVWSTLFLTVMQSKQDEKVLAVKGWYAKYWDHEA